jgi:hypothetical protein
MQDNVFRFVGCANPPGREHGYNGFELDKQDVVKASRELVGVPLLIEHSGNPVGRIEDAWVAKDGRLLVCGATSSDSVRGLYAKNMIAGGSYPELSIGSTAFVDPDALRVTGKTYNEVSIVERGLRDGTTIDSKTKTRAPSYKARSVGVCCSARSAGVTMTNMAPPSSSPPAPPVEEQASDATNAIAEQTLANSNEPAQASAGGTTAAAADGGAALNKVTTLSEQQIATMTNGELMARLAALQAENKWLGDKTKRSYEAAFDAATEKFLSDLKTEDTEGKIAFINSLKQMTQQPGLAGREGNAVMEVAVAASRQNRELQHKVESQLQELKRLKGASAEPAAQVPDTTNATVTNFAQQNNRGAPVPVQRVAPTSVNAAEQSAFSNKKMFDWISAGTKGIGMERMAYSSVAGKDFSKPVAAYNQQ